MFLNPFDVAFPDLAKGKTLHIVGPYNSGTNFLRILLTVNGVRLTGQADMISTLAFKHYPYTVTRKVLSANSLDPNDIAFLVVLRHPFEWVASLKKSPYELFFDSLAGPSRIDIDLAMNDWRSYRDQLHPLLPDADLDALFTFSSVPDYWNRFYGGYFEASSTGEINAIFVRYEDIVSETVGCVAALQSIIGQPTPDRVIVPLGASKPHGRSSDYLSARRKLLRSPDAGLTSNERRLIYELASPDLCAFASYSLKGDRQAIRGSTATREMPDDTPVVPIEEAVTALRAAKPKKQGKTMRGRISFDTSDTSTIKCPACQSDAPKALRVKAEGHKLFTCSSCQTLIFDPPPVMDYSLHTANDTAVRDYVEMNAAIDFYAQQMFSLCDRPTGRLLEIGCGFGFGLDFAEKALGWEVRGYEPSTYGSDGARLLGIDVRNELAPENADSSDLFDIVYCSEVIEHVSDPWSFLRLLTSYLKDDGVLYLTTPNSARIAPASTTSELLALLSPGSHVSILPAHVLEGMLRVIGFTEISADSEHSSVRIRATRRSRPREVDRSAFDQLYPDYLRSLLKRIKPQSSLARGVQYRLYRWFVDHGLWDEADASFDPGLVASEPDLTGITNLAAFAERYPLCAPIMTYCRGMQFLNAKGNYPEAARHFRAAFQLCEHKLRIAPSVSVVEEDIIWLARYHEGLSLYYGGENGLAREVLLEIVTPSQSAVRQPNEEIAARSSALLSKLAA